MGGLPVFQTGDLQVKDLEGFSNLEQAEQISQHYANVSNQYQALKKSDIPVSLYKTEETAPFM